MKILVQYYQRFREDEDPASLEELIPKDLEERATQHKFLVLRDTQDDSFTIVIGPVWVFGMGKDREYYHKQILAVIPNSTGTYQIRGGGWLRVSPVEPIDESLGWKAKFYSRSGDYGKYDYAISEEPIASEIARILGMKVLFE